MITHSTASLFSVPVSHTTRTDSPSIPIHHNITPSLSKQPLFSSGAWGCILFSVGLCISGTLLLLYYKVTASIVAIHCESRHCNVHVSFPSQDHPSQQITGIVNLPVAFMESHNVSTILRVVYNPYYHAVHVDAFGFLLLGILFLWLSVASLYTLLRITKPQLHLPPLLHR